MNVRPAPGVLLRDPVTKQLLSAESVEGVKTTIVPPEGMPVGDHDLYWVRRIRDRDAVKVQEVAAAAATSSTTVTGVATSSAPTAAETGDK